MPTGFSDGLYGATGSSLNIRALKGVKFDMEAVAFEVAAALTDLIEPWPLVLPRDGQPRN